MSRRKEKMTSSEVPNILVSISGEPKTGKSHLAMTFPEPIKIYSFDGGAEFVRKKRFSHKAIEVAHFTLPIIESTDETWALPVWEGFYSQYKQDVESGKYRTLIIDTATAMEATLRQAILEEHQNDKPSKKKLATNEYVARNLRMKAIFDRAAVNGVNLVVIQYLKEEWVRRPGSDKAEPTGKLILDGWNQTEGFADINLEMTTKTEAGRTFMVATIKSNRFEREMNGKSFKDTTYDDITALLLGE
jgi:hypothetical protein